MEQFYLILVIVLFALAISDLVVGVSNDAVNFLNSAIGSKAAPKWVIFGVASIGVLVGATFSSGMMEVARKGIFHPDMFFFAEIMVIFMAVMITDVILLDLFNTLGLPTSTTVSIVFELLGAAVAVSVVKINQAGQSISELHKYINSEKALAIITGILLSVFIAFIVGAVVQYIARLIFSFKTHKTLKYFGSAFGGLAIAGMTYFMIIKGAKGASFMSAETVNFLKNNILNILLVSFVGWTVILQLLYLIFKIDIPKVIVLVGTFGLAMAFAGNDLVNFIGVPLAGFSSFKAWMAGGAVSPDSFEMGMLSGKVPTPTYMLVVAGFIMIITLITSRKARSVVATTVDLSRQSEGDERFGSSAFSRTMVRTTISINKGFRKIVPAGFIRAFDSRFEPNTEELNKYKDKDKPAFDKIRASVNLVVASILISIGTSLKLPLSTTYVTFMVAMGTSLADRAWDRESAVYRISGVFTVIGGWFMTALVAFSVAAFIAWIISISGNFMIFIFVLVAIFMVGRTYFVFKKKAKEKEEEEEELEVSDQIMEKTKKQVLNTIMNANQIYSVSIDSFIKEDRSHLKESLGLNKKFQKKVKKAKDKVFTTIQTLQQESMESGHCYVQIVDYQREISHSLRFLVEPLHKHLENNHKPFVEIQLEEMTELIAQVDEFFNLTLHMVKDDRFEKFDEVLALKESLTDKLTQLEKKQIKRIKAKDVSTRNSLLFFNVIKETKNLVLHSINLVKSQRDFVGMSTK
ncbi:inorganic phosphate transporter [Sunxiuqinia elliptica]|uniref:Phosphate transporter n=1 Tax=Sunxiuqinia elliptica TaxID=655355 RepID=A0A4R6H1U3_9BACT|nr:inorganic phosphate transporter [Sunxiuqinia elliptica]TDO01235.1 phosphate transporter family protein [Sunxiuqinia elliptica]TDO57746.1 phosphate transporter family protein [Sunxiuqinia elliptica]